jgi:hypothetical protein
VKETRGMTRYLGVRRKIGFIVAEYTKGRIHEQMEYRISRKAEQVERLGKERRAAEQYDQWAWQYEGSEAKTNFLPDSIYKNSKP